MPNYMYSTVQSLASNYEWNRLLKLRYKWLRITIMGLDVRKQLLPPLIQLKDFANIEQVEADLTGSFLNKIVRCTITATDPNHMSSRACNQMKKLPSPLQLLQAYLEGYTILVSNKFNELLANYRRLWLLSAPRC